MDIGHLTYPTSDHTSMCIKLCHIGLTFIFQRTITEHWSWLSEPVFPYLRNEYFVLVWLGLVQSGLSEDKMSLAPVWLWGGSSSLARKTALTKASVCVIIGLQEERGTGGEGEG